MARGISRRAAGSPLVNHSFGRPQTVLRVLSCVLPDSVGKRLNTWPFSSIDRIASEHLARILTADWVGHRVGVSTHRDGVSHRIFEFS